jgi:hypothetical protein
MNNKVSDFKIAESIIRKLCKRNNVGFIDVPISFDNQVEGSLFIDNVKNIAHTTFKIVAEYVDKSMDIINVQLMPTEQARDEFFIILASNLRSMMYGDDVSGEFADDPHSLRLYQYPLVWILLKDIICPIYNKNIINLKVINDGSAEIDIAKYYKKEEIPSELEMEESFIFVNIINNRTIQNAFIFIEALKALDLSPIEVIKDIYETDLYEKYHGLLELALDGEEEITDFECAIRTHFGLDFYGLITKKVACIHPQFMKMAQNSVPGLPNQFWQLGVLEKMIEPFRGSDWSVYKGLEPYVKEFWDKVEDVRKTRVKKGHDSGVPFDLLLRIKSKQTVDNETDVTKTIQSLLSSDRVW